MHKLSTTDVFALTIENGKELSIRMCFNFFFLVFIFLFSTQNQVPKMIIGMGRLL